MDAVRVKLLARMGAIALATVLFQLGFLSHLDVAGGNADLLPLVVMSIGLLGGALAGAAFGFSVGLLTDLALMDTLGITSLVLLAVGYWCGRAREVHTLEGPLVPLVAGALATLVALVGFSVLQFLLGADPPLGGTLLRQITATLVLNALLAVPVHWLVTRASGGSLVASRPRRRRAYTTGGLSPLYSRSDGPISR
ncbi:MAG: rod shape-determining protein MreD [Actinomycetota bacterium]|nr:rod shape-determining protein MreD [Actinomycetota bacterium]